MKETTLDRLALRIAIAFIWLSTGLGVLHPYYREIGRRALEPLGLPEAAMFAACVIEVFLGLRVLLLPPRLWLTGLQIAGVIGFTIVLGIEDPSLLVHPFGMLSKNVPLIALMLTAQFVETEGWSSRARWTLRAGMAFIWIWEGLMAAVFFQTQTLTDVIAQTGVPLSNPPFMLTILGLCQAAGGVAALVLRGRLLRGLLACQFLGLVVISILVTMFDPLLWWHPFGPITKNIPLLIGTALVMARES